MERRLRLCVVLAAAMGATWMAGACGGKEPDHEGPTDSGTTAPPTDAGQTDAGASDGGTSGTDGGDTTDAGFCLTTPQETTLTALLDPSSPTAGAPGASVRLRGAVVTSPRFIVSRSTSTGRCTIGVFVADATATSVPYGGVLLVRSIAGVFPDGGAMTCPLEADVFPADLAPGDLVNLDGKYEPFGPNASLCSPNPEPTPAKAAQVTVACPIARIGTRGVPTPATVTPNDLLNGSAPLAGWSGGLVQVSNVRAKTATAPGDSTFGTFTLDPSGLPVGSKIYSRTSSAPTVTAGQQFNAIIGIPSLDICTWTLQPRSPCDFTPPLAGRCP
jgi:hypothetical protein